MTKKTIPTFRTPAAFLSGQDAVEAWANQNAKCACGCPGRIDKSILGTASDMPAKWLGCQNCCASTVGRPLVYRSPVQVKAAIAARKAATE